jgi:hypothetical protein
MTYRERREAKAERLREWAAKREGKASDLRKRNEPFRGDIAFASQPGHLPERDRANRRDRAAWEHSKMAGSMRSRADGIESQLDTSIYSDDPDAIERLREKVERLEAERDRVKRFNATARKGSPDYSILDEAQKRDLLSSVQIGFDRNGAFPAYVTSNLSGNIKRARDRLQGLECQAGRSEE